MRNIGGRITSSERHPVELSTEQHEKIWSSAAFSRRHNHSAIS
jgi:hypothetical protein